MSKASAQRPSRSYTSGLLTPGHQSRTSLVIFLWSLEMRSLKIAFFISIGILITGCVTSSNRLYNQIAAQGSQEAAAWDRVNEMAVSQCHISPDPEVAPPKKVAMKQSKCLTGLVNEQVIPYALFPELTQEYRKKQEFLTGQYVDGKISANERAHLGAKANEEYHEAVRVRSNQILTTEYQRQDAQQAHWGSVAGGIADIYRPDPVTTCTPAAGGTMRCVHSDGRP